MNGQVVRGVAGRREEYRPIVSRIAEDSSPESVARVLVERFSFSDVYVAELNAIAGSEPDWPAIRRIAQCGLNLWLDIGIRDARQARRLHQLAEGGVVVDHPIIALESLPNPCVLQVIFETIPHPTGAVFSLDLKNGEPLTVAPAWRGMSPIEIARQAVEAGFRHMIVLDLAAVGTGGGIRTAALCRQLRMSFPDIRLIGGGGVRGLDDLQQLAASGCDAALVASAIHDGLLSNAEIQSASAFPPGPR